MNYSHFLYLSLDAFEMIEALMLWEWTNEKLNLKQAIKITKDINLIEIDDWIKIIERWDEQKMKLILEMIKENYTPEIKSDLDVNKLLKALEENWSEQWKLIEDYVKKIDSKRLKIFDGYYFFERTEKWDFWNKLDTIFLNYIVEWNTWKWLNVFQMKNRYNRTILDEHMMLCSNYHPLSNWVNLLIRTKYLNEHNNVWTWIYLFDITILALAYAWATNHEWWLKTLKKIYNYNDNPKILWFEWLWKDEKIYQVLKAQSLLFKDYKWDISLFWRDVLDIYYKVTWNKNLIFNFLVALSYRDDDCYSLIVETLDKIDFKKSINIIKTNWNLVERDYDNSKFERNRSQKLLMEYLSDCDFVKDLEKFDKEKTSSFISWYLCVQDAKSLRKFFPNIEEKNDNLFMLKLIETYECDSFYYWDAKKEIQKSLLSEDLTKENKDYFIKRIEEIRKDSSTYRRFLSKLETEWLLKFLKFEKEKEEINYIIQKIIEPTKKELREMKKSPIPIISKTYLVEILWYLKEWNITKENWKSLKIDWYQKSISVAEYFIRYCELWNVFSSSSYGECYFDQYFEIFEYFDEKGLIWEREILAVKEVFENYKHNIDNYSTKTKTWKPRLTKHDKLIIEKIQEFFKKHNIKEPETKEEFIEKTVKVLKNQFWEDKVFINKNNNIEITSLDDFEKLKEILSKLEYL